MAINFHFRLMTIQAIKFHTNPFILSLKWSAREPGWPVQQPRDLIRGTVKLYMSNEIMLSVLTA